MIIWNAVMSADVCLFHYEISNLKEIAPCLLVPSDLWGYIIQTIVQKGIFLCKIDHNQAAEKLQLCLETNYQNFHLPVSGLMTMIYLRIKEPYFVLYLGSKWSMISHSKGKVESRMKSRVDVIFRPSILGIEDFY